ncbi:hypothetical protein [Methylomicrobium agile]|uniref:hypothetical protein n=1 Tax=Methylomicrobium agile TaxID=39774 RepID=UPI0012F6B2E8|nr:hypothetical protein [Methylomicrobium agile]
MKDTGKSLAKPWVANAYRRAYTQAVTPEQGYPCRKTTDVGDLNRTGTDASLSKTQAGCRSLSRLPEFVKHLYRWQAAASQPIFSRKRIYAYL